MTEQEYLTNFSRNMKAARERAGLSLRQLAIETGIDHQYLSLVERGEREIGIWTLYRISTGLKIDPAELLK